MVAGRKDYAAPTGLDFILGLRFYKDAAPTALVTRPSQRRNKTD